MEPGAETLEVWSQMHDRLLSYIRRHVATFHDAFVTRSAIVTERAAGGATFPPRG